MKSIKYRNIIDFLYQKYGHIFDIKKLKPKQFGHIFC